MGSMFKVLASRNPGLNLAGRLGDQEQAQRRQAELP